MEVDANYQPRKFIEKLKDSIGRGNFYENNVLMAEILEARAQCIEIVQETNKYIDEKLQQLELPGVKSITLVQDEHETLIVKIHRDHAGNLQLDVTPNKNEHEPDVLSLVFNDAT